VKYREFLGALLKSLKKGRLHKLFRLLLVLLFFYLSFLVGRELLTYYVEKRKEISISLSGLSWDFSLKKGELSVAFNSLEAQTPTTSVSAERGKAVFLVYKSLTSLKPTFREVSVERVAVTSQGRKEGGKLSLPPVRIESIRLGNLLYTKRDLRVTGREIVKNDREIGVGGLVIEKGPHRLALLPFRGVVRQGVYYIPRITATYREYLLSGSLELSQDFGRVEFSGFVSGGGIDVSGNVKLYGKQVESSLQGKVLNWKVSGQLRGEVKGEGLYVERFDGRLNGIEVEARGELGRSGVELSGRLSGKEFKYKDFAVKEFSGKVRLFGEYKRPRIEFKAEAKEVKSPHVDLVNISARGTVENWQGKLSFASGSGLDGTILFTGKEKLKGSVKLKEFPLIALKAVKRAKQKYPLWVPEGRLNGELSFLKEGVKLSYSGAFKVKGFKFQDYVAGGNLSVKGGRERIKFTAALGGSSGSVEGRGEIDLKGKAIDAAFVGRELLVDSLTFLRKAKLSGRVSGSGVVRGALKEPQGAFEFKSRELYVAGVNLSPVEGKLRYENRELLITAQGRNVFLEELRYSIKGKELFIKGLGEGVKAEEVVKLLAGYGVKLPFGLEGELSGQFSLRLGLGRRPVELSVESSVREFSGKFVYGELLELYTRRSSGELRYSGGEVEAIFSGPIEKGAFKGYPFVEGSYGAYVKGKRVIASYNGVRATQGPLRLRSSGSVELLLDEGEIKGNVACWGSLEAEGVEGRGQVDATVGGKFSSFTVKVSGKLGLKSPYVEEELKFKVEGAASEPENVGNIRVYGKHGDLRLLLFGSEASLVGKVRELNLKSPKADVKVNLAFVNLKLPGIEGMVSVPTFTVKPYGFYRLYSPTGVYINVKGKELQVSDFSLAYVDGWIEFKDVGVEPLKGKFIGELGAKGLIYLAKLNKTIPFARNSLKLKGEFEYLNQLNYRAEVNGDGVILKSKFILDKVVVNRLRAEVENSNLKRLEGELSAGDGNALITQRGSSIIIALSLVPVGQLNAWKSLMSGNLTLNTQKRELKGSVELSRTRLFFEKEKEEAEVEEERALKLPIEIEIGVLFDEPVKIKSELFWIEILPNLKVITVNGEPVISGNFYTTAGEIDYMGKKFKVIYGSGTIEDLKRKKGRVSILASAYISGYYVYMKIEGPLTSPTIYLTSDPPLTREQIMNLIMTGASPEQIEASSEIFPAVQIAYYAASSFFKPIESKFQKALGLESFTVEPYITRYGETVAKLTITKRLTKRIRLIGYETTGQNPEYGGSIQLFLTDSDKYYLELRYNSYYGPEAGVGLEVMVK